MKRAILAVVMSLLAGLGVASAQKVFHGGVPPTPIEREPVVPDSQPRASATCLLQLPELTIVHEPASGIIQIASMGTVLSYGGGWDHRQVKPYLFHLRHQSWKGAFWKVNTSRGEVTLVWGGLLGGTESALDIQVRTVAAQDSLVRPRTTFTSSEQDRLQRIGRLVASGAAWSGIARECDEFVKMSPGTDRHAAVAAIAAAMTEPGGRMTEKDISQEIAKAQERLREAKAAREEAAAALQNATQKQAQSFETLSAVLKRLQEADEAITRSIKQQGVSVRMV